MAEFDPNRAWLRGPDCFKRYSVDDVGTPIEQAGLAADRELIIVVQPGGKAAFVMRELTRPHMAQGRLAGTPYLVTF